MGPRGRSYLSRVEYLGPEGVTFGRPKTGIDASPGIGSISSVCAEIDYLARRGIEVQGGMSSSPLGGKISGGSQREDVDRRPAAEASELAEILTMLHAELRRICRHYGARIHGAAFSNSARADWQLERVRYDYPDHWYDDQVALAENVAVAFVREHRKNGKPRVKAGPLKGKERVAAVKALGQRGYSVRQIATELDVGIGTVHRDLAD